MVAKNCWVKPVEVCRLWRHFLKDWEELRRRVGSLSEEMVWTASQAVLEKWCRGVHLTYSGKSEGRDMGTSSSRRERLLELKKLVESVKEGEQPTWWTNSGEPEGMGGLLGKSPNRWEMVQEWGLVEENMEVDGGPLKKAGGDKGRVREGGEIFEEEGEVVKGGNKRIKMRRWGTGKPLGDNRGNSSVWSIGEDIREALQAVEEFLGREDVSRLGEKVGGVDLRIMVARASGLLEGWMGAAAQMGGNRAIGADRTRFVAEGSGFSFVSKGEGLNKSGGMEIVDLTKKGEGEGQRRSYAEAIGRDEWRRTERRGSAPREAMSSLKGGSGLEGKTRNPYVLIGERPIGREGAARGTPNGVKPNGGWEWPKENSILLDKIGGEWSGKKGVATELAKGLENKFKGVRVRCAKWAGRGAWVSFEGPFSCPETIDLGGLGVWREADKSKRERVGLKKLVISGVEGEWDERELFNSLVDRNDELVGLGGELLEEALEGVEKLKRSKNWEGPADRGQWIVWLPGEAVDRLVKKGGVYLGYNRYRCWEYKEWGPRGDGNKN